jgi:flagellar biosynthetic protein FliO
MRVFWAVFLYFNVISTWAKESINSTAAAVKDETSLVGSHVSTNMNAASMLLSLLMVLFVIVVSAFLLKRFNLVQTGNADLKVISSLALGNKEKVIVVQVGKKQLLLGVTAQQITLLESLDEPIKVSKTILPASSSTIERSVFSLLKKHEKV